MVALSAPPAVRAQLTMQPQLPSQGLIQQNQLWNIMVLNNGDAITGATIQLTFQEEGTGRKIFTAVTSPVYLARGASQLSVKDMGAVQYDYLSASYGSQGASAGLLPIGRFIVCYTLFEGTPKGSFMLAQDCLPLAVEPFSPLRLAYPADKSEVTTANPVFSWIPPAPANMFSNLNYKLIVAEVKPGQTATEALQRNAPLLVQVGIRDVAMTYPSTYTSLQPGKTYAWQVVAQNDNTYSSTTDPWSFSLRKDTLSVVLDWASYPHLQRGPAPNHFVVRQKMKFSYDNEANDSLLAANIYADRGQVLYTKNIVLKRGVNFIDLDLSNVRALTPGSGYVLEMVNGRKENWDLRFTYEPLQ